MNFNPSAHRDIPGFLKGGYHLWDLVSLERQDILRLGLSTNGLSQDRYQA
jgi:hypothetical protein